MSKPGEAAPIPMVSPRGIHSIGSTSESSESLRSSSPTCSGSSTNAVWCCCSPFMAMGSHSDLVSPFMETVHTPSRRIAVPRATSPPCNLESWSHWS